LRLLLPQASERVNLFELYSRDVHVPAGRPFVRVNMVSTLDGAVAFSGRAGSLGGPGDKLLFSVLRSLADVVLVGAGTARVERYGPPKIPMEAQEIRRQRGQDALPTIAVVTRSGALDWGSRLFAGGGPRPIVIAAEETRPEALAGAAGVADVLTAGTGAVDLRAALKALGERGLNHVLCEGGPTLNTGLAAAQLVDELCLTLSPKLAGWVGGGLAGGWLSSSGQWSGPASPALGRPLEAGSPFGMGPGRPIGGQPLAQLLELDLAHVVEEDSFLFLRLRARYNGGPAPS